MFCILFNLFTHTHLFRAFALFHLFLDNIKHGHTVPCSWDIGHPWLSSSPYCSDFLPGRCQSCCGHLSIFGFHFPPNFSPPSPFCQLVPASPADVSGRQGRVVPDRPLYQLLQRNSAAATRGTAPHTPYPPFHLLFLSWVSPFQAAPLKSCLHRLQPP